MDAVSNRGRSVPGGRESVAAAADPGDGVGRGVAGNAKMFFAAAGLPPLVALSEAAFFSALAATLLGSSPALLFFCCAHSGNAKNALIASAAHQLRISFLPALSIETRLDHVPDCRSLASFGWLLRTYPISSPRRLFFRRAYFRTPTSGPGKKPEEARGRGAVRLFYNSLAVQLFPIFWVCSCSSLARLPPPAVNFRILR